MKELQGKNAVVTAGGSGIGRAIAGALAGEGMRMAILDVDQGLLNETRDTLRAQGATVDVHRVDVSEREAVHAVAAAVERELGAVHVLCSNAGVNFRSPSLDEVPDESFDWLFSVNVFGTFNVIKAFVPGMRRHGAGGHVVLTASVAGLHALPSRQIGVYSATKMAVVGMAEFLRDSLSTEGIGVSVLCPGNVATRGQSGHWRAERFGGPFDRPGFTPRSGMDPNDIGKIVLRGIQDDEFYLFSHPTDRRFVADRFNAMSAAFDRWERVLPQLGIDPTLPVT
jgi:NAD(P)-dependent dehydrogenase (short-subunit alcohol dehydrogenase family)